MNKTKNLILVFAFLFMSATVFSQANFLQWVKSIGSVNSEFSSTIRVDHSGTNMYVLGTYKGTMDVDPSLSVTTISLTGAEIQARFLAKYDVSGNFIWVKTWKQNVSVISDFEINTMGDIVIGISSSNGDVDPGIAVYNSGSGGILKLDSNGIFKGFYSLGANTNQISSKTVDCIALDKNNNILVNAYYTTTNNVPATRKILGWWKLSATGTILYSGILGQNSSVSTNSAPSQNDQYVRNLGLETDSLGNIYALAQNYTTPGGNISSQSELTKISSTGTLVWKKTKLSTTPSGLSVGKGVYAMQGTLDKFDFAGNAIWNKTTGGLLFKCDKNGNLYGFVGSGLVKYDSDGILIWTTTNLKANSDFAVDKLENIYWTGYFNPTYTYTLNGLQTTINTVGGDDHVFGKLSNCIYDAPNICLVTVDSLALNNVIYWDKTPYLNADSFIVYRFDAFNNNYLKIGAVAKNSPNNFLIDTARSIGGPNGGNPQYSSYRYKLAIKGTCGAIGTKGLYHESIFIQQNNQNFSWNAYGIEGQTSPATGYQFMRDNTNVGNWQVLVNTGGLSTTDPNYASYPNGNWRVDALGFSCNPTAKLSPNAVVNRSKSNVKNNFVVTSANELELNANVFLSPNPAKTELTVNFSNHQQTKTEFVITDVLGKIVSKTETLELNKITIPLNDLSSGVYFLKIKQGKLQVTKKFIKE